MTRFFSATLFSGLALFLAGCVSGVDVPNISQWNSDARTFEARNDTFIGEFPGEGGFPPYFVVSMTEIYERSDQEGAIARMDAVFVKDVGWLFQVTALHAVERSIAPNVLELDMSIPGGFSASETMPGSRCEVFGRQCITVNIASITVPLSTYQGWARSGLSVDLQVNDFSRTMQFSSSEVQSFLNTVSYFQGTVSDLAPGSSSGRGDHPFLTQTPLELNGLGLNLSAGY